MLRRLAPGLAARRNLLAAPFCSASPPPDVDDQWSTLAAMQRRACAQHGPRPLFGVKDPTNGTFSFTTYDEFGQLVAAARNLFVARGVTRGDRVACISSNRLEWAIGAYAAYSLGAPHVPMYETQSPKDWEHILSDSGAKLLMVANPHIEAATQHLGLDNTLVFDAEDPADSFLKILSTVPPATVEAADEDVLAEEDIATLIYTSGTTGKPKGVMLSHKNLTSNVQAMRKVSGHRISSDTVSLSFLPWAHIFGQTVELHALMSAGGAMGLAESPATLLDDLQQVRPTLLVAVPTVFNKVFDGIQAKRRAMTPAQQRVFDWAMNVARERRDYFDSNSVDLTPFLWLKWQVAEKLVFSKLKQVFGGRLQMAITGGAALSFAVQEFFEDVKIPIIEGYGLTETSPAVAAENYGPTAQTQGGLQALEGVEIRICHAEEGNEGQGVREAATATRLREVPAGEAGEICVLGPNVMVGYWQLPEQTAEALASFEGRRAFRTGDLGSLSTDGVLQIRGRIKEQYKLENGKFVVPGPIEDTLRLTSKFIAQVFVHGLNEAFNVMLLVPDMTAVHQQLGGSGAVELSDPRVQALLEEDLRAGLGSSAFQGGVKGYEIPRRYTWLEEEFSVENGLLTPKLSMKRMSIQDTYAERLKAMYGESGEGGEWQNVPRKIGY